MALHVAGKFQCFLLLVWVQLVSAEIPAPAFRPITKPHCVDKCGKVSIPYPFGIYNGCYADKWFKITCNDSLDSPKPVYRGFDVSHISLLDSQMRIEVNTTTYCSDEKVLDDAWTADLGKFTFSSTKNKLKGIGCNPGAHTKGYFLFGSNNDEVSGALCWSICNTTKDITDGSCLGIVCCDVNVPAGLSKYNATPSFDIIDNTTNLSSKFCGHAFLVEESSFKFSSKYLKDFNSHGTKTVPAVVDWAIGNETCDAVRKSRSYACGPNTVCISGNADVPGYRCKCKKGYKGNPYLNSTTGGNCQDIDECGNSNRCGSGVKCMNTPGSYRCFCSPGKHLESTPQRPYICIGVSIAIILFIGMSFWLYTRLEKRKQMKLKEKNFARNGGLLFKQKVTSNDGRVEKAAKIFVAEELEKMTDNFNQSRIIGKGGFGTVFKGMLPDGEIVAIKKSTLIDTKQVDQFINEVVILSQINHRHIVKLLGCCLETQVPLLVYEFVTNGTLSDHLHVEEGDNETLISWKDRVRIASEIAGALAYLHSEASIPIYHRDIKTTNILLDEKYKAKVSDFGISRSAPADTTHLTTLVQGTFGYLDPEYFHSSQFTDKSDVYSFGIVLLELLTGEMTVSKIRHEAEKSLALYFVKSLKENRLSEILDARVLKEGDTDDVLVVGPDTII